MSSLLPHLPPPVIAPAMSARLLEAITLLPSPLKITYSACLPRKGSWMIFLKRFLTFHRSALALPPLKNPSARPTLPRKFYGHLLRIQPWSKNPAVANLMMYSPIKPQRQARLVWISFLPLILPQQLLYRNAALLNMMMNCSSAISTHMALI